jgi:hypothetical protein
MTLERVSGENDPALETIKMQVAFEALYATELRRLRDEQATLDRDNRALLTKIIEIGTDIQSNAQVASLYRAIFKLLLANAGVDAVDRGVEREVAAALESVFPQAGLNAFNMMKKTE